MCVVLGLLKNLNSIMILLIRYGSMELRTFWTNLNSIMILLIRLRSETFDASQDNLNSIMILLIPRMPLYFALFQSYLNSIMILLILNVTEIITGTRMLFKFHYDSINSRKLKPVWRKETEI